jgi:hypothetical protein
MRASLLFRIQPDNLSCCLVSAFSEGNLLGGGSQKGSRASNEETLFVSNVMRRNLGIIAFMNGQVRDL